MEERALMQRTESFTTSRRPKRRVKGRMRPGLVQRGIYDLNSAIDFLLKTGDLARVETEVSLVHELAGIAQKLEGGKVALFERVKGYPYKVLTGLYWNRQVLARMFGCDFRELPFLIADAVAEWQQNPVDPIVVESAPCQEVVVDKPNLADLPIPVHALEDGGPYIDSAVVVAKDPDTGVRNASIMRFMVAGPDLLTGQMDEGRHLRDYYERAEARGQPLEITINNGVDPSIHFAATVPASAAPIDKDELGIASHLRGEPLELVPGKFVNVEAIASAQFVIEAEALPHVRQPEGPFAEVTGYYAPRKDRWTFRVKGITMRRNAIWQTILSGKEVYNSVGLLGEAAVYRLVSRQVPAVQAVYFTHGGCGFYHAVIQLKKNAEGVQKNAIMATFAAFPSLKMVIAVDEDVDIYNPDDVEWALAARFRADRGLFVIPFARGHELNPSTDNGVTHKVGIDATAPYPRPEAFERAKTADVDLSKYVIH